MVLISAVPDKDLVAGARYDINGRNVRAPALAIDLRQMDFVRYNLSRSIVEIGEGVSGARLLSKLAADVVVPTTAHLSIGLIWATIARGYGSLSSKYGLVCDNFVSVQVVLADSSIVIANADNNQDLFWAVKKWWKWLRRHDLSDFYDTHPVETNIEPLFLQPPGHSSAGLVIPFYWKGPEARGRAALQSLLHIPGAIVATDKFGTIRDILDVAPPRGRHDVLETVTIRRCTLESITSMVESAERIPTIANGFGYNFLHDFHGKATTYQPLDAAFSSRAPHYVVAASGGVSEVDARGYEILT